MEQPLTKDWEIYKTPKYKTENENIPQWILNEAHLINEALDKNTVTKEEAESGLFEDAEIREMMRKLIKIQYFVEYPLDHMSAEDRGAEIFKLFKQKLKDKNGEEKELADFLAENNQGVSIAMITLDEQTAEAVRYLNNKGVAVAAWIVVDDLEGYWTNTLNVEETIKKTEAVKQWAKDNQLKLTTIGFDSEKPLSYIKAFSRFNVREMIKEIREYRKRVKEKTQTSDPKQQLEDLLGGLKKEGFETEVYVQPKFLKGLLGGIDIKTADRYIEMVYTSMMPSFIREFALKLFKSKDSVAALGLVAGKDTDIPGRDLAGDGKLPHYMTQEELEHDLMSLLDQELDFGERKFTLRDVCLFAINSAPIAAMMTSAMDNAFMDKTHTQNEH